MSIKDSNTEKLIKDTAMRIFFKEGRYHATTQEIADAAGVNRTLVHYYFRSRDLLFSQVLGEGKIEFHKKMMEMVMPELSFREKISHMIDIWMEHRLKYPFLDTYLVSQLNNPIMLDELVDERFSEKDKLAIFFSEIEREMEAGTITKMNPLHFLLNLVAMVNHPIIMRPLLERMMSVSNQDFNKIITERKEVILNTLFKK